MKKIAVIGLGQFGQTLAETLTQQGAEFLVIDKNEKLIEDFKDKVALAVVADATEEEVLLAQAVQDFDAVVVAIGDDNFLVTVLITTLLKKIGVNKVIARGIRSSDSQIEEKILELVGADRIVLPSVETAKRLAQEVLTTDILNYIPICEGYSVVKIEAPDIFFNKSIKDLQIRDKYHLNLIGIERDDEINYLLRSSDKIEPGDQLIILGKEEEVEKFSKNNEENNR